MDQIRVLIRRYVAAAWRYRWATVACAWVLSVAGWVGTTFIPNQYEANARLYVDADAVLTPLLHGIAIDTRNNRQLDVLQRTLLSRPNLEKLISNTDLDLQITGPADLERLVKGLGTAIRIVPQTENLFTISYRDTSPKLAFDVVQSILTTFIESKAGNNRAEMQNAQVFIDQQLASYERKLREAEKRRADFKTKYIDLLPSDATGVSRFEQAQETVRSLQGQLQDQIARRDMLKGELSSTPAMLVTETDINGMPLGGAARTPEQEKLKQAEDQLTEMRLKYTDNHPDVVALRKLIESLKGTAAKSVATRAADRATADAGAGRKPGEAAAGHSRSQPNPVYEQLKVRLVEAEGSQASLQRQLAEATRERDRLQEIARGAPGLQAEFTNLNRDYDVLRKNYEELLGRREAMRIASAADAEADKIKIQIVDPPQVPQNPVAPKRALMISAVLVGALGAGFGLALLLAQFDQSFHTLDELRDIGLPVAGSISLITVTSRIGRMASAIGFSSALALLCAVYAGLLLRLLRSTGHA